MTVEEYRNRLMDAFHNANCDELIAVVVRPEESKFKQLEWLLKNHYHNQKQQPCEDCISRQATLDLFNYTNTKGDVWHGIKGLPPVIPKEKTGKWEMVGMLGGDVTYYRCSECNELFWIENGTPKDNKYNYCPSCGSRMVSQ